MEGTLRSQHLEGFQKKEKMQDYYFSLIVSYYIWRLHFEVEYLFLTDNEYAQRNDIHLQCPVT